MPKLKGIDYLPFPFHLLSPDNGKLTWIREFEDSPVEQLVLEFSIPSADIPGDEKEEFGYRAVDEWTNMTLEAKLANGSSDMLDGLTIESSGKPYDGFGGSIYLGERHHGIDLKSLKFSDFNGDTVTTDVECRVFFTHEGLSAGENARYDDTDWNFRAPVVVKKEIHSYRIGKTPSMLDRAMEAAGRIFRSKG